MAFQWLKQFQNHIRSKTNNLVKSKILRSIKSLQQHVLCTYLPACPATYIRFIK